jgi:TRAP-type uncharacterized transport system substrate-binding protein
MSGPTEGRLTRGFGAVRLIQAGLLLVVVLLGLRLVKEAAPSELMLFTGATVSSEYEYGQRYAEFLSSRGVQTTVVATAGASDNVQRLEQENRPAVAFVTSGVGSLAPDGKQPPPLVALASLYIEPAWLFVREGFTVDGLPRNREGKTAIGFVGADAALAELVVGASGIPGEIALVEIAEVPEGGLGQTLDRQGLAAVFALGAIDSAMIQSLFSTRGFSPISFERAAAYTRLHRFLAEVEVPQGAIDMTRNLPTQDLTLVAPTVQLIAPADVPPAIVDLLLEAAQEIHREPTFFSERGEFPSMKHVSLPLHESAIHFFEDGPPALRKALPYWAATLVDRFATFIVAVAGAAMALLSILPRLLGIPMQIRLKKWLAEMVEIEKESMAGGDVAALIDRLDALDRASVDVPVFRFQLNSYLEYRQLIYDGRDRLRLRLPGE